MSWLGHLSLKKKQKKEKDSYTKAYSQMKLYQTHQELMKLYSIKNQTS